MEEIDTFGFEAGDTLWSRYRVLERLGAGWEGEAYLVEELSTQIPRAAKLFFPHNNRGGRTAAAASRKLHRLYECGAVVQYIGQEELHFEGQSVTVMLSEYVVGDPLAHVIDEAPGQRLETFEALCLLRAIAAALAPVHARGEYHGDIHTENVVVNRVGISFRIKLLDVMYRGKRQAKFVHDDVVDLVRVFGEMIGGPERLRELPRPIRAMCGSFRRDRILERYKTAGQLRDALDRLSWD
jgi:serine/threonine protein kinase